MNGISFAGALLAAGVLAGAANAAVSLNFNSASIGATQQVSFGGFTTRGGPDIAGLSAQVDFTLTSISHNVWTFNYRVTNTSGGAINASRVSIFGFDTNRLVNYLGTSSTGEFDRRGLGAVPLGMSSADVCFKSGGGVGNCSNGGNGGASRGESDSGSFSLAFFGSPGSLMLDDLFVRYEGINSAQLGMHNAMGVGSAMGVIAPLPEPTSWALMIGGFGMVGWMSRRRRFTVAA